MKWAVDRGDFGRIPDGRKYPVIIYMHGCLGITDHNTLSGVWLASQLDAAVIQPLSFAREYRPRNCTGGPGTGGKYRPALGFRIAEANHAIREARRLAWIDADNVFLMGMSEGGITTAKFTGEPVNARIIEGATCHHPWREWNGLSAPESEPVLSLLGANDPWQTRWRGLNCGSKMSNSNGSKSIVVTEGRFANDHAVLMDQEVKEAVKAFFNAHLR
jgi:dienelactone hydrolase